MKRAITVLLILLAVLAVAGCGSNGGTTTTAAPATTVAPTTTAAPTTTVAPTTTATPTTTVAGGVVLTIDGAVSQEKTFTLADLQTMEVTTSASSGATGVLLNSLLNLAGVDATASTVTFTAADGYTYETDLANVAACTDCMVAFNDTGGVSLDMPGWEGKAQVKDVIEITAS